MAKQHEVRQGESISSIAYDHGFFWQTVWNDSHNTGLKQRRKDPNVLLIGDVVFIPDLRPKEEFGATEQSHRFRCKGVPAKLYLRILEAEEAEEFDLDETEDFDLDDESTSESIDWDEQVEVGEDLPEPVQPQGSGSKPRANLPYLLGVDDGIMTRGETTSDGLIECTIAPNAQKATLVLNPDTVEERVIHLKIGHLDPVQETSGAQARLNNLGFRCGRVDGVLGPRTRRALENFQASAGLKATGELDERTRQKLHEAHEST